MEGEAAGAGDAAATVAARRRADILEQVRTRFQLARDRRDFAGDAVHRGHHHRAAAVARQPGDAAKVLRHLALAAVAIHRVEERLVAEAPRVLVARGDFDVGTERIGQCELVADVGAGEPLLEGFIRAAVGHRHAGAVVPDDSVVVVAAQVIGIRGDEGGEDGVRVGGEGGGKEKGG